MILTEWVFAVRYRSRMPVFKMQPVSRLWLTESAELPFSANSYLMKFRQTSVRLQNKVNERAVKSL